MFRPSKWFGWNRAGAGEAGSPAASRPSIEGVSNPHSLEHLKTLYTFLDKNQEVTEDNKSLLVETLRQIAEILIWGDQNDATVFDYFLEKNMLYFFLKIMKQKCGGFVCTQLLQTLNILFENIRNETSLYYLLSNNHVNSITMHKFDFDDEEVMAYYISFIKTLSLKLNVHTVHFFFNESSADFPLYTEAIKFFNHSEKMVRIAVRTLTLNVFAVRERAMLRFIRDHTAAPYFSNLAWFIGSHVIDIETSLVALGENRDTPSANSYKGQNLLIKLEDLIAEHLDHLHYLNDILRLNIEDLNSVLSDNLQHRLIIPLYLHSFLRLLQPRQSESTFSHAKSCPCLSGNTSLSPSVALFLLTQAYLIFSFGPLLNTLVTFLLRSSKLDIELNANRCEFLPPPDIEQTLASTKAALEAAHASEELNPESTISSSHSMTESVPVDDSVPTNDDDDVSLQQVQSQPPQSVPSPTVSETESRESEHMETASSEPVPVPVLTITNWPEFPFLIALLSSLNSSIASNRSGGEESGVLRRGGSSSSTGPSGTQSTSSPSDELLSKSCHSPIISRSIVQLSSADDRIILFTLALLTSILSNKDLDSAYYRGVLVPPSQDSSPSDSEATHSYYSALINSLLLIMRHCSSSNSSIRIVTFELAVYLFRRIVFFYQHLELVQSSCPKSLPIFLSDHQLAVLEQANEDASHVLRQYFRSTDESVFLELFEQEAIIAKASLSGDEKDQLAKRRPGKIWSHNLHLTLEQLFMDSTLLLPPDEIVSSSSNDSNFYLRLPMNEYEKTRYAIKVFFILRRLSSDVRGVSATTEVTEATENMLLPPERPADFLNQLLDSTETYNIALDQLFDLENTDLNSCSIRFFYPLNQNRQPANSRNRRNPYSAPVSRSESPSIISRKMSRFMVITSEHVILIEPDTKHYGWGIIRFIARLQDIEFWSHAHAANQPCTPTIPRKEKDDIQSLYAHFRRYQLSASMSDPSSRSLAGSIVIRFSFDDQIRCYAAKQHLTKAQSKVHDRKISAIIRLIDLNSYETSSTVPMSSSSVRGGDGSLISCAETEPSSVKQFRSHEPLTRLNYASQNHYQQQQQVSTRSFYQPHGFPGKAVLSPFLVSPTGDTSLITSSASTSAKYEMLNKTKYAYPAANKVKVSSKTGDSEVKHKKKLKNPNLVPNREEDGIPLNDLSPKTVRRNAGTSAEQKDTDSNSKATIAEQNEYPPAEPTSTNQHHSQTETIDI